MFRKIRDYIFGKNKIEITGLNIDRLLNTLAASGVIMTEVRRVSHRVVTFCVSDKRLKRLISVASPLGYNINILSKHSLKNSLVNIWKTRPGIIFGLIIAVAVVAIFNMFVWDIKINGNDQIQDKAVLQALENLGVKKGVLIDEIDRKQLAQSLTAQLEEASLISVEIKGITLIINIKERIPKPEEDKEKTSDEIISAYDCVITKIAVLNGTPQVKIGDVVKKGEVLAAAFEEYYEGSQKQKKYIRAEGEFWGKVWFTHTRFYAADGVEYVRTGNKKTKFSWELFGIKNLKNYQPKYNFYETRSSQQSINFLLPIKINKTVYYELKPRLVRLTPEQAQEFYGREILEEARLKIPQDAVILNSFIKTSEENGLIRLDAVIETELKIGTRQKLSS
ncbi:MAG TPA: sporulation protein YqfD [Clostridia bacterium]